MIRKPKTESPIKRVAFLNQVMSERKELDKVKEEQENTLASIHYARRIQDAILINREELKEIFHDFSIVYEPKDIVSGDFYYAEKRDNQTYLVVGDCTGHGVPGAFMSILCNDLIVRAMKKVSSPHDILTRTNELLIKRLNQGRENAINDGMDVSVALIDYDLMTIRFSGAMNEGLLLKRNGEPVMLKATRTSMGKEYKSRGEKNFLEYQYTFEKGDFLYLFTDGYKDQFNERDEKMGKRRFLHYLSSLKKYTISEQEKLLNRHFQSYKAGTDQIDDVLVLGVQL